MQAVNAAIGGEGSSGGVIFPAVHLCRDSYMAMAFVLDWMAESGKPISELVASLPPYTRLGGKVVFEHGRLGGLMQALENGFPGAHLDRSDGLKMIWDDRWLHVRASNTEPLLRLAVEARHQAAATVLYEKAWELLRAPGA
jgi:phosphomannomutase